jgi:hypothetical protein
MLRFLYVCSSKMKYKINLDGLGMATSLACAVHCAVLPLVVTSFPVLGINILDNTFFEYGMIFLALFIGVFSLYHGYKKHHHRMLPIAIFSSGIALLFAKQIWHQFHIMLLIPAVIAIISAHFFNYRFCRTHNHAHDDDCNH